MIACTYCGAATYTVYRGIAYSCTRKVAAVLLDAMLLDLSRLGHNGLVHNAREAGGRSIDINCRSKAKDGAWWHLGRPENAVIEAGRQRDRRQRGAAMEGVLTEAREAGGQLDRRHRGAAMEGALTEAREAGGQLDRRH